MSLPKWVSSPTVIQSAKSAQTPHHRNWRFKRLMPNCLQLFSLENDWRIYPQRHKSICVKWSKNIAGYEFRSGIEKQLNSNLTDNKTKIHLTLSEEDSTTADLLLLYKVLHMLGCMEWRIPSLFKSSNFFSHKLSHLTTVFSPIICTFFYCYQLDMIVCLCFFILSPPAKWHYCDVKMHAVHFWGQERGSPDGRECLTRLWLKRKEGRGET